MPAENAGRAFALVLADELADCGVRHAVVAPGSRSTPIALALLENPHIKVHVRIDERSAAYLALGIAKATASIVPVLCTSGTATSYFHAAVMEADLAHVPLLVLTADRPPELHGIGANQTVDQVGMFGAAVRWAPDVPVPEPGPHSVDAWRAMIRTAAEWCDGANHEPVGPVHLNLPLRDPLLPVPDDEGFPYELGLKNRAGPMSWTRTVAGVRPTFVPDEIAARVAGARRGVLVVGGNAGPVDAALEFARAARWPVIAEPHSNARVPDLALRATDALLRDRSFATADLAIVVGRVGLSRTLLEWLGRTPHVVIAPGGGNWDVTRTALAVIRPHLGYDAFDELSAPAAEPAWSTAWHDASRSISRRIDAVIDESPTLTEPAVARDVAALLPDGAALVVSSSMPIRDLDVVMAPRDGLTIYANRGVSGIDGFVSTAQGIAIGRDGRGPTVALCGDLSLLHDVNGLLPAPDPRPDVTYVVINNDGGGIFSLLSQGTGLERTAFERLFGTPHGVSIEAVAAAYQAAYTRVRTAAELAEALAKVEGVRIVEVRTDRAENAALHARIREIAVADGRSGL
ncbi:MAG: 2-succinyl-5-enolpyruvyl-6-hydroxy-3-cyclohexene-1-carboxylic-acid synthase [Frankiaceae bacterium]|nr:2-succinyl-5-enolpyruvyl-6-hydroxy-3-cyclohexene-1-carboxylic-acid synthase [Frankiaceae bacterium]